MRRLVLILTLSGVALTAAVTSARADLVLAVGGAWPGGAHGARPSASLGWRGDVAGAWRGEVRSSRAGSALSVLRPLPGVPVGAWTLRPSLMAGVDFGGPLSGTLFQRTGYHLETGLAVPLPEGALLELSARWVMRGQGGMRGPDRFAANYAEITLGFVFRPD